MPRSSKNEIRLVVKTDKGRTKSGETCVVDISKGLNSLLRQVSTQIDFDVGELSLLSYKEHIVVASSINNTNHLRDLDIVLAIPSGEAATSKHAARATGSSSKKRKVPSSTKPKYRIGTKVRKKFGDHGWFKGSIISVDQGAGAYQVKYEDGDEEEYFFDENEIDKIVGQGKTTSISPDTGSDDETEDDEPILDDESDDEEPVPSSSSNKKRKSSSRTGAKYSIGTKVRRNFGQFGWAIGTITSIQSSKKKYLLRWSDGDEESYAFDDPELDDLVQQADVEMVEIDDETTETSNSRSKRKEANTTSGGTSKRRASRGSGTVDKNQPKYGIGTVVRKKFRGYGWFNGEIVSIDAKKGSYKVQYSDGDMEEFFFDENAIDKLVQHAINNTQDGGDSSDEEEEEEMEQQERRAHPSSWFPTRPKLNDAELCHLKGKTVDLDDLTKYLVAEWYLKPKSVKTALRQAKKFLSGDEISYVHWPKDVVFKCKPMAELSCDYYQVLQDAMKHEEKYGKCSTKILSNPLVKLIFYQEHYYKKNISEHTSGSKPSKHDTNTEEEVEGSEDDNSEESREDESDREEAVPQLTDEQRSEMKGDKIDIEDFKKYLSKEWFIRSKNLIQGNASRLKKLMNSDDIAYKHWPDSVVFRASVPVDDLSAAFYQIRDEAIAHEKKYGSTKGSGSLKNFMTKLVHYQDHHYRKNHEEVSAENGADSDDSGEGQHPKLQPPLLTDKNRLRLKGTKIDLEDLENYLSNELNHDANFVRSTIKKVKSLMDGEGISYKYWKTPFHREKLVDMSANFHQMQQDSITHEKVHGEDRSKGKLIRYPLFKMEMYQEYLYEKQFSSGGEAHLTKKQREELSSIEFELEDFESFLSLEKELTKGEAQTILQRVKQLASGKGISSKAWDKGVMFHPPPISSLGEDFVQMLADAEEHEESFGEDKSGRELLMDPIRMLIRYQNHSYAAYKKPSATTSEGGANGVKANSKKDKRTEPLLTDDERARLEGTDLELDDFETYLTDVENLKSNTVSQLMKNAKTLTSEEAIYYKGWPGGVNFRADGITDMSTNFFRIRMDATAHEKKHGNAGKSLLIYPLLKLESFQKHLFVTTLSNGEAVSKTQEDSSDNGLADKKVVAAAKEAPSASSDGNDQDTVEEGLEPALTNEELQQLKGEKLNMDDFEVFLLKKCKIQPLTRRVRVNQIKHLIRHGEIPYTGGTAFRCKLTDLSQNFRFILQRAVKHERKYGSDKKEGANHLLNPLRNLIKFQKDCYDQKKKEKKLNGTKPSSTSENKNKKTTTPTGTAAPSKGAASKDQKKDHSTSHQDENDTNKKSEDDKDKKNCMEEDDSEAVV